MLSVQTQDKNCGDQQWYHFSFLNSESITGRFTVDGFFYEKKSREI